MNILNPISVTDAILTSTNVAENDHPEWDVSATYDTGDEVISTSTHKIYESVQDTNLGNDPTTDDGTYWTEISATNRWKAFDSKLADQVVRAGSITYSITPVSIVTGVAFFGLGAKTLRLEVYDDQSPAIKVFDKTVLLVDDSGIFDWFTFFTTDLSEYQSIELITGFTALAGYRIDVTIEGVTTARVGEMVFGKVAVLGETIEGSTIGLRSFSTKEQDAFGNWTIVPRDKTDPAEFRISVPAGRVARVKREITSRRDLPTVYFADESLVRDYGAITYGFPKDFEITLVKQGRTIVTLEIEGLP
jgi:hypothetical protein